MTIPSENSANILIASESATTADLLNKLLEGEFKNVFTSIHPHELAEDFDRHCPGVLVLAFSSLEKSERFNLGLYRQSREIHEQPHRTVVICHKDEVQRAYELCRDEIFDDYVLFWPLAFDGPRLPMAVHNAMRELATSTAGGLTPTEFTLQVRRLAELEALWKQRMTQGDQHIESTCQAIAQAEQKIGAALTGFSRRLTEGKLPGLPNVKQAKVLEHAFDRLKQESIEPSLHGAIDTVQPLKQWADDFRKASAPHIESIRSLHAMVEHIQQTVMVVDDDEFQLKLVGKMLQDNGYRVVLVSNGIETLNMLRKIQPNIILMDISMPNMDGLEVTRRIKGVARFATIPIIMITSNSEEDIVNRSLKAGAIGFMVKPLNQSLLIGRIAKVLATDLLPSDVPMYDLKRS
ncbi:MAG: response regulator [Holophaga sp.]|nr:response regulator [Holophaga sp.]